MKVILTGAGGQLGQALIATQPALLGDQPFKLMAFTRSELDLSNPSDCKEAVDKHLPEWIINAGAYTAVDKAQHEPDLARIVNVDGPAILAQQLALRGGRMLQLSTDFVFNGLQCTPYSPFQEATPTSIYGQTKAQSEAAVLGALGDRAFVMRTSWLYGPVGKNFALTMLRLHEEKNEIQVVVDQVGSPTSTLSLALACWKLLDLVTSQANISLSPIQHWSDAGVASWYDFAEAIGHQAKELGLIKKKAKVIPIRSSEYPFEAPRPSFSVLDCSYTRQELKLEPIYWVEALREVLSVHPKTQIKSLNK